MLNYERCEYKASHKRIPKENAWRLTGTEMEKEVGWGYSMLAASTFRLDQAYCQLFQILP